MTSELIIVSAASLLFILLLVASALLWIIIGLRLSSGQPVLKSRFRSESVPVPNLSFFLVIAYIVLVGVTQLFIQRPETSVRLTPIIRQVEASITEGIAFILILTVSLLAFAQPKTGAYRLGFRGDSRSRQIGDGILGFIASILPVLGMILLTLPLRSPETTHPFLKLIDKEGFGVQFYEVAFAAVIIAPLKEELMFRVILQSRLVSWLGVSAGIGLTAVLFAAVHGFPDSLGLLPLALILGYVYQKRRSFLSIVVIHALFNAFNVGMMLLQKQIDLVVSTWKLAP